jgi:hypothetical protein
MIWPNHWDGLSVVWPQNSKPLGRSVSGLASKPLRLRVSGFGLKTGGDSFSRFGLKTGDFEFPGLGLKTDSYGLVIWASKSPRRFLGLELKTKRLRFVGCATKQTEDEDITGHASKSSSLLHVEACWATVSQSGLRLVEARHGWCT